MHDGEVAAPSSLSTATSVTDTSEESVDGSNSRWFGMGDLASMARSIRQNFPPIIDGFAETIHRSAMNLAAEFSEMEREAQREALRWSKEFGDNSEISVEEDDVATVESSSEFSSLSLPWEVPSFCSTAVATATNPPNQERTTLDMALKSKILALSLDENIFLGPFQLSKREEDSDPSSFNLDAAHVDLIRRLLEIDDNLCCAHASLSGKCEEQELLFWKNYLFHCNNVRMEHLELINSKVTSQQQPPFLCVMKQTTKQQDENEHSLLFHDDEVDAELIEHPPASCTGFYSRTGNPSLQTADAEEYVLSRTPKTLSSGSLVLVGVDDAELAAATK